jgi:hypothetical protein
MFIVNVILDILKQQEQYELLERMEKLYKEGVENEQKEN